MPACVVGIFSMPICVMLPVCQACTCPSLAPWAVFGRASHKWVFLFLEKTTVHWKHSRFEIAHVILGNCHTYDEAYRILCELEEDRDVSIKLALAESKRAAAKVINAKVVLKDTSESQANQLQAQCNIDETDARREIAQPCLDEGRRELAFIRSLKKLVNSHRLFHDFPDHVAHQLAQPAEWKFDLFWKTYNHLCSSGHLPYEHLMLLKMHPSSQDLLGGLDKLLEVMQADPQALLRQSKNEVLTMVARGTESSALVCQTVLHAALTENLKINDVNSYQKSLSWG